jgi:Fe-S-cluster containining protein
MRYQIVLEFDPNIRFECIKCGSCCRTAFEDVIPLQLYPQEVSRIRRMGYRDSVAYIGQVHYLKALDSHCIFLTDDGLCILRLKYGWSPVNCRLFPITVKLINDTFILDMNWDYSSKVGCRGFGSGPTIAERFKDIEKLLREIDEYIHGNVY